MTDAASAPWLAPSPRLWRMRQAEVGILALLAIVVALVVAVSAAPAAIVVGIVAVVLAAGSLYFVRRRVRAWGYLEREEDLLVRRGVLVTRLSVVPYGRMQLVEVTAGLMERAFGLSTVKLHTAAAHSDARIPGLEPDEAARLRDRLAALGEAKAAGL
ncbi:MAG TPA: PH domain-containing protein [Acidimicrobiales bacterium]|nr:PH domain-containing protein [Acidimicrobiales bacterium]